MAERQIIQHLRTNETNVKPSVSEIEYGEIAINYKKDEEKIFIKNDNDELITFVSEKAVAKKQDVITDLATIRSNAAKGATALQSVPAEYVTEMELANKNYVTSAYVIGELNSKSDTGHTHPEYITEHQDITGKQDVISDLATIRSNAAKGATALQEIPSEYVTDSELAAKGYLTQHQSLDEYAKTVDVEQMIAEAITIVLNTEL